MSEPLLEDCPCLNVEALMWENGRKRGGKRERRGRRGRERGREEREREEGQRGREEEGEERKAKRNVYSILPGCSFLINSIIK
jgi:hypothetical protein